MGLLRGRLLVGLAVFSAFSGVDTVARACDVHLLEEVIKYARSAQGDAAREKLIETLAGSKVPAFLKSARAGKIPVILVNKKTVKDLKPYFESSMGTQIALQPHWNNDHGQMRLGGTIMDVDTPGGRAYGEINETGIAWKDVDSYVPRRGAGDSVLLEVSYVLTPDELDAANYYHRVRRAALIRVPFTFGGGEADPSLNNLLESGEHCFVFCKGGSVSSHVDEIKAKLSEFGIDGDAVLKSEEGKAFIRYARGKLMKADPYKEEVFGPDFFRADLSRYKGLFPARVTKKAEQIIVLNYLVGLDATIFYQGVLTALNISSDLAVRDMNNPRATAVLVYDARDVDKAFANASYESPGKFYSWMKDGQEPIPKK